MILGALVLGAFLMCLVFIYISSSIDVKEHPTLKYFFLLFGIIFFFVPLWLCLLLVNQYYPGFAALSDALALIVQVYSYIIYCILAYILIYIFYMMYNRYVENRNKEFGYDER